MDRYTLSDIERAGADQANRARKRRAVVLTVIIVTGWTITAYATFT